MRFVPERILRCGLDTTNRLFYIDFADQSCLQRQGDGYLGWPEQAPFDCIILTAAPPELPPALLSQLKPGGRLVAPVGTSPFTQTLTVVDKGADGTIRKRAVAPVMFVPMVSGAKTAHQ